MGSFGDLGLCGVYLSDLRVLKITGGRDYSDGEMEDGVVATFNDDRGLEDLLCLPYLHSFGFRV